MEHRLVCLYADAELQNHAAHSVAIESSRGYGFSKEKAAKKIDSIAALGTPSLETVRQGSETPLILVAF